MDDKNRTTEIGQFTSELNPENTTNEEVQLFDLDVTDDQLLKITANQLTEDVSHWETEPWLLTQTDKENIAYLIGIQSDGKVSNPQTETPYVDNRLFASVRAMLAYATGQPGKPELLPSKTEDKYLTMARNTGEGMYQHVLDHKVNQEFRLATKNLIHRKRGCVKLRYDPDCGPYGDIVTENIDPADVVVGRFSKFGQNPDRIYHKQKCTIQELVDKFPDKKEEIYQYFGFQRGVYSQTSRVITYWECWFTYYDKDGAAEGLCWFIPNSQIILGKMQNPNWIRKGSKKEQKIQNLTDYPVKPFVWLNYWNTGRSFIDETCLFDQGRPLQDIINKRGRQIVENADYSQPRVLANGTLWDESDAKKFVNKSPKTIGLLNNMSPDANINNAVLVIPPSQLASFVMEDKVDARIELDTMMGTPTQFQGANSNNSKNPTLGQDLLIKNQSSALQDDLVGVVMQGWATYYTYLLQMMNTYLDDDYYVMTKGQDGAYNHILLNSKTIDTNVRVTITVDSTLPIDKNSQRATAIQLLQMNKIDLHSAFEMIGLPNPQQLADRTMRSQLDPMGYMNSVEQQLMSAEAESDITLIINNKVPDDRDDYDEDYLNHWNLFLSSNRFTKLPPDTQQELTEYLQQVANKAALTEGLRSSMLNPAGIIDQPVAPKAPDTRLQINGMLDPAQSAQAAGLPPPQAPAPGSSTGSPPAPIGQASPPRMTTPTQFTTH